MIVTPRQHQHTKTNFFFPNKPPSYHPLPTISYRYSRATSTPEVESLVCALSTTKGTVQPDPADYPGFCDAHVWEGDLLLKNNLPVSMSVILRKVSSACSLFLPHPSAYSTALVQGSALPQHSLESFRVFPTPAGFGFTQRENLHPVDLVMRQVFGSSRLFVFFPHHTKARRLSWTAAIHFFLHVFFCQNVQLVVLTKNWLWFPQFYCTHIWTGCIPSQITIQLFIVSTVSSYWFFWTILDVIMLCCTTIFMLFFFSALWHISSFHQDFC